MDGTPKPLVAVVTGASAGLGRAIARAFAQRRAKLGLLARGEERLGEAAREVEELGGEALPLVVDVAEAGRVEWAAEEVEKTFGPIDVWVNNAMTSVFSFFTDTSPEDFRRVTEVTYLGYVYGTLAALRRMLPRDLGSIVQVGSALSERSIPLQAAYCGAKHAIRGFTDSIRCELLHRRSRVRITIVQMPAMNTPQFDWVKSSMPRKPQPVPPVYQPEIGAEAVWWAAHHHRREVWVGLPTVKAMWGNKIAPGVLDLYLARRAVDAQQRAESDDRARPFNLWAPVPGPFAAHGSFGAGARNWSLQFWASRHKWALLGASAAAGLGALLWLFR